jgi:hypothetical protein
LRKNAVWQLLTQNPRQYFLLFLGRLARKEKVLTKNVEHLKPNVSELLSTAVHCIQVFEANSFVTCIEAHYGGQEGVDRCA